MIVVFLANNAAHHNLLVFAVMAFKRVARQIKTWRNIGQFNAVKSSSKTKKKSRLSDFVYDSDSAVLSAKCGNPMITMKSNEIRQIQSQIENRKLELRKEKLLVTKRLLDRRRYGGLIVFY